ncbi:MAG: hypothetical protein K2K42_03285 [Eubacterium sp.]|nr:hypothetical protein [Eubacterium sp.]
MKKIKIISIILTIMILFSACASQPVAKVENNSWNTNYKYVFVHGLSGWGSYDSTNKFLKYWGMFGGDLLGYLNEQGFDCYAASVDPQGSAWDRACELYAAPLLIMVRNTANAVTTKDSEQILRISL